MVAEVCAGSVGAGVGGFYGHGFTGSLGDRERYLFFRLRGRSIARRAQKNERSAAAGNLRPLALR
jgi:hypothetical protein